MLKLVVLVSFLSVALQAEAECMHNRRCFDTRGVIKQSGASVSLVEKVIKGHRWWNIQPRHSKGTILLAFKGFQSTHYEMVKVHIFKRDGRNETRIFSGRKGNFEVLEVNVFNVVINATVGLGQNTNFTLHYYSDCEVSEENPVMYPEVAGDPKNPTTCRIITPHTKGFVNRIYFTLRYIVLPNGIQLTVQDVHTSEVIATIEGRKAYTTLAVESSAINGGINSYYVLLDLSCSTKNCDMTEANYLVSHYPLNEEDIWCLEVQKQCTKSWIIPDHLCEESCPALEAILLQEVLLESNLQTTRMGSAGTIDNEEEKKAEQEGKEKKKKLPPSKRKLKCPKTLPKRKCQCSRDPADDRDFCDVKLSCKQQRGCTWRCIFTRFVKCAVVRRFVVKLI